MAKKKALTFTQYIEKCIDEVEDGIVVDVTGFFRNGRTFGGSHRQTAKKNCYVVTSVRTPRGKQVVLAAPSSYWTALNERAAAVAAGN